MNLLSRLMRSHHLRNKKRMQARSCRRLNAVRGLQLLERRELLSGVTLPLEVDFNPPLSSYNALNWNTQQGDFAINQGELITGNGTNYTTIGSANESDISISALVRVPTTGRSDVGFVISPYASDDTYLGVLAGRAGSFRLEIWHRSPSGWSILNYSDASANMGRLKFEVVSGQLGLSWNDQLLTTAATDAAFRAGVFGIRANGATAYDDLEVSQAITITTDGWDQTTIAWGMVLDTHWSHLIIRERTLGTEVFRNWVSGSEVTLALADGQYEALHAAPGTNYARALFATENAAITHELSADGDSRIRWRSVEGINYFSLQVLDADMGQTVISRQISGSEHTVRLIPGNYYVQVAPVAGNYRGATFVVTDSGKPVFIYHGPGKATLYWSPIPGVSHYLYTLKTSEGVIVENYWTNRTRIEIEVSPDDYQALIAPSGQVPLRINLPLADFTTKKASPIAPIGETNRTTTSFSWFPIHDAFAYYFQLVADAGESAETHWAFGPSTSVELTAGTYRWRVTPINERREQGRASDWVQFSVTENRLVRENIFGIESHLTVPAELAKLTFPESIVSTSDGTVFVADTLGHSIRRVVNGQSELYAGTLEQGFNGDGYRTAVHLDRPSQLLLDENENLLVLDSGNRLIRRINRTSGQISTIVGVAGALPSYPSTDTIASETAIAEADTMHLNRSGELIVPMYRIDDDGFLIDTSTFRVDHEGRFHSYAMDKNLLVVDVAYEVDHRDVIYKSSDDGVSLVRTYNAGGSIEVTLGGGYAGGIVYNHETGYTYIGVHTTLFRFDENLNAQQVGGGFANIATMIQVPEGLLIIDGDRGKIATYDFGGNLVSGIRVGGSKLATDTVIRQVRYDENTILFLQNKRGLILSYDVRNGESRVFAGNAELTPATLDVDKMSTGFYYPVGIAVDAEKNVYVSENNRILKIDTDGFVTSFAGSRIPGYSGDGGPAAHAAFMSIRDIAFDGDGNLIVADTYNDVIRRIDRTGTVTTIAGNGRTGSTTYHVPATDTHLNRPLAILPMPDGTVLVANSWSNHVLRLKQDGTLSPFAGLQDPAVYQGLGGYGGDLGPAELAIFDSPSGLSLATDGTVFIADTFNHRIRAVLPDGTAITVWGTGSQGYRPDGSILNFPTDVLAMGDYLYLTDTGNGLTSRLYVPDLMPNPS